MHASIKSKIIADRKHTILLEWPYGKSIVAVVSPLMLQWRIIWRSGQLERSLLCMCWWSEVKW